jgi:site-specific recombinase XerD
MLAIGQSKYEDKKLDLTKRKIYSWSTYKSYLQQCCQFVRYCKDKHHCKNLADCRQYVKEWMESRKDLSAYTQKLSASALCKLYGESLEELEITTKRTVRSEITRSRGTAKRDAHFSEQKNADFVEFCRSTGLRRSEITKLRGDQLIERDGEYYICITGKGGRYREAPVCGNVELVIRKMQAAGTGKVWKKVPSNADIHSYRADYATRIYSSHARPIEEILQKERYICRKDKAGIVYDKNAMLEASKALGHNRISVVGEHYLRLN